MRAATSLFERPDITERPIRAHGTALTRITAGDRRSSHSSNLPARVKLPVHVPEMLLIDVRVDLGRRDIGVPEEFLDDTKVRPVSK